MPTRSGLNIGIKSRLGQRAMRSGLAKSVTDPIGANCMIRKKPLQHLKGVYAGVQFLKTLNAWRLQVELPKGSLQEILDVLGEYDPGVTQWVVVAPITEEKPVTRSSEPYGEMDKPKQTFGELPASQRAA